MELDWTTFTLEILNFLVLAWILKRFLYRPVLDAISRRRAHIEQTLADARKVRDEAQALKEENQNRSSEWESKRQSMLDQLTEEISAKRERMLGELSAAAERERERNRALEERRQQEWLRATEEKALAQGSRFAAALLSRLASPELDARLFEALIEDLNQLAPQDIEPLIAAAHGTDLHLSVTSAFPLSSQRRALLVTAVGALVGRELPADFSENASLLGGLRMEVGPWVLQANLRDELAFFRGIRHGAP